MKILHSAHCSGSYTEGVTSEIYKFIEDLVNNKFKRSDAIDGLPYSPDFLFYTVNLTYINYQSDLAWDRADDFLYHLFNKSRLRRFVSLWQRDEVGHYFMVTPYIQVRYTCFEDCDFSGKSIDYKFVEHRFWHLIDRAHSLYREVITGDIGVKRCRDMEIFFPEEGLILVHNRRKQEDVPNKEKVFGLEIRTSEPNKRLYNFLCIWPELHSVINGEKYLTPLDFLCTRLRNVTQKVDYFTNTVVFPKMMGRGQTVNKGAKLC